jgi:type VI secretion system protein ImpC
MAKDISFGKFEVGLTAGRVPEGGAEPAGGDLFRIAVLGDFTGRASRGVLETGIKLAGRKPVRVDRDNFDDVMARLGVELHLPVAGSNGGHLVLRFKELDDFRPDRLFPNVEIFQSLRETRRKLNNPATFQETADQMRSWAKASRPEAEEGKASASQAPPPAPDQLLDQILGGARAQTYESSSGGEVNWNALVREIVTPYAVPKADPLQAELVAQVDAATSGLMRAILHHPDFQALEAAWRGLFFLVRRLDTDHDLQLFLLDISRADLIADLADLGDPGGLGAGDELTRSGLYRLLVEQTVGTPGAPLWVLLAGNYTFAPTPSVLTLLGRMAQIACQARAPFVSGITPAVVGCNHLAGTPDPDDWKSPLDSKSREAWNALRRLPEAPYLGLAMPRFLLRLPYGSKTDPIEGFAFDEMAEGSGHETYLWANPAFACAYLLGEAFNQAGWKMRPGLFQNIEGLPVHVYTQDGDQETKPCAEVVLGHRASDIIMDAGVMPLLSMLNQDTVRLAAFRSVAEPAQILAGRWH